MIIFGLRRHPKLDGLIRIVYSNQVLSSYLPIEIELVKPFYQALKTFTDLCYRDDNLIKFKLKEGTHNIEYTQVYQNLNENLIHIAS